MKENLKLSGISETLLVPLMGRALETQKRNGILRDSKSLEIFSGLAYDFKKFEDAGSARSMLRTTIRTAIIDEMVKAFLQEHSGVAVVEIGCGLNTRFERVGGRAHRWYDLDLPQVHRVWVRFFQEHHRRSFLPYSAFDFRWMQEIDPLAGPRLFISEASLIYFTEEKVRSFFKRLHQCFPGSHYLFDSATPGFLSRLRENEDALKYCDATMKWTIEDIHRLKEWVPDIQVIQSLDLEAPEHEYGHLYPKDFIPQAEGYRLNLVRV